MLSPEDDLIYELEDKLVAAEKRIRELTMRWMVYREVFLRIMHVDQERYDAWEESVNRVLREMDTNPDRVQDD